MSVDTRDSDRVEESDPALGLIIEELAGRIQAGERAGRLPDRPGGGPRGHGGGLRGGAGLAPPPRGAEGPAVRRGDRPEAAPAVPDRGPGRGAVAPYQHRAGLRDRLRERRALL